MLTEYFGYLRRDIDQGGYDFWVDVLNTATRATIAGWSARSLRRGISEPLQRGGFTLERRVRAQ